MIRLKNNYAGKRALIIFAGPSIVEQKIDLAQFNKKDFVVFLDTKALTPFLLQSGLKPDYFLMMFPEKAKDNSLHQFIFRSLVAKINIRPLLRKQFRCVYDEISQNFHYYYETWNPKRGLHKSYRWRKDKFLPDSPVELLEALPETRIITHHRFLNEHYSTFPHKNELFYFDLAQATRNFDIDNYYQAREQDGMVIFTPGVFFNSAAICVYPMMRYMGFKEVYLLGSDMTMLGSFEYAAPYTFVSMWHYWWYFVRSMKTFNAAYKVNKPYYYRPQSEFDDAREVLNYHALRFIRVSDPSKYVAPLPGVATMSVNEFLEL